MNRKTLRNVGSVVLLSVGTYLNGALGAEYFAVPAAVRLEGVGEIFGVGAGAQKIFSGRTNAIAGMTFGEVEGAGFAVSDIPIGSKNLGLNLAFANVAKARFQTSYSRGLKQESTFEQEVSATVMGATVDWWLSEKALKLSIGAIVSEIQLEEFYYKEQRINRPSTGGYHPIETTSMLLAAEWDKRNPESTQGYKLGAGIATAEGRTGQSDIMISNLNGSAYLPLSEALTLALHARWSDAHIMKKETRYTDFDSVKSALGTNCGSIADATEQSRCELLEDSIADYVARNNKSGTAAPIGGSNGLRAYNELSVRAAHTRLFSTELRWMVAKFRSVPISVTPFYDLGWSADHESQVFRKSADSFGVGLRASINKMPIRLTYADTNSQSAWFFTAGQAF